MAIMNIFRVLGDLCHFSSKCILIWAIHWNKSAEGVSFLTQSFYAIVFITRYLDIFTTKPLSVTEHGDVSKFVLVWNFILKLFYITSSLYILFLMLKVYTRSREREKAWKLSAYCLAFSLVMPPIVVPWARHWAGFTLGETIWAFSIVLESVCVLPQLLLLRQTNVPTVIDSFYLLALGSYRGFYILNWIERFVTEKDARGHRHFDPIAVVFGVLQTLLYLDFAWVYYTRQRVKLRGGGVVDSDDLRRGWLLRRILGGAGRESVDEERGPAGGADGGGADPSGRWGRRGISVSADEGLLEPPGLPKKTAPPKATDAKARDDELAGILEDEDDDSDDGILPPTENGHARADGVSGGEEWRDASRG
jgi:hypothetical protein